jgi:hypothetical protein
VALTKEHDRVVQAARSLASRLPHAQAVKTLGATRNDEEMAEHAAAAWQEVEDARRGRAGKQQEALDHQEVGRAATLRAKKGVEAAKRLQKSAERVEQWLSSAKTVASRVDEGRQSLWRNKLDTHLRALGAVTATQEKGELILRGEDGLTDRVRSDLTAGTRSWIEYVQHEVENDFRLAVFEAWTPLDGPLPIPSPMHPTTGTFRDLHLARPWDGDQPPDQRWWERFDVPELERRTPVPPMWSEFARTLRQHVFSVTMILGLAGLTQTGADDGGMSRAQVLGIAALLLLPVAWFIVQRDRNKRLDRSQQDGLKAIQEDLLRWAEGRLERTRGRIREFVRYQLLVEVRPRWVEWYAEQVVPCREQATASLAEAERVERTAKEQAQTAERDFPTRELDRLRELLKPMVSG